MSSRFSLRGDYFSALLAFLVLGSSVSWAQTPAQKPLTNRDGGGVSPNLMVVLDTSRSMDFQHAPEYDFKVKTGASSTETVTFPNFSYFWMHPYDPGPGYYDSSFKGIVPSNPYRGTNSDNMLFQMQMRSPDLNTLYYNPERRYLPWIKADKSRMTAYLADAAPFIPMLPNLPGTITTTPGMNGVGRANLTAAPLSIALNTSIKALDTGVSTSATRNATINWCYKFTAPNTPTCQTSAETYYPMVYYRLKKNSGYYLNPANIANYTFTDINAMKLGCTKSTTNANNWTAPSSTSSASAWTEPTGCSGTSPVTVTSFPKYADRADCLGASCTQTEERQNFSNWFTYYRSRTLMAQGAIPEAFADTEDDKVRLGWGRIHKASSTIDGAATSIVDHGVRSFGGTATTSVRGKFISWLRNHPGNTDSANGTNYETVGGTPLMAAVDGIGKYYQRADNGGPWSDNPATLSTNTHKTCRRSYNMLVTDGYYGDAVSAGGNLDGGAVVVPPLDKIDGEEPYKAEAPFKDTTSNTLADLALRYWATDLRPTLTNSVVKTTGDPANWQHMTNYMIGLGVNGTLDQVADWPGLVAGTKPWPAPTNAGRIDDLWHAAVNSRGAYYSVKEPKEMTKGIKDALGRALEDTKEESGVATASAILEADNRKYVPRYRSGDWYGDVEAHLLNANGDVSKAEVWKAKDRLPAHASRSIWTWNSNAVPPAAVPFTWATMGSSNQTALGTAAGATEVVSGVTKHTLVEYIRGDQSKEGDNNPFRKREYVLGDFVNSNPVLVRAGTDLGYTALATGGSTYATFRASKAARAPVLFVGGNDGMLHGFKDSVGATETSTDGQEVFAYVPKTVISNLHTLSNKDYGSPSLYHQFYVDGPQMETDAYVNPPGGSTPEWRNYLLGSLGAGGRAVYALDVTSSPTFNTNTVRWEINASTYSDLGYITAPIQAGVLPNGEWVAIFGNGFYSGAGKASLFVVSLQTGAAQTLDVETVTGSNGLGGVGIVRNTSGHITTLYAGDLKGKVWKFDYQAAATSRFEISGGAALFTATSSTGAEQPITQPPAIFDHTKGGKLLVVGTGKLITETDANNSDVQSIYGIWDKGVDSVTRPMSRTNLEARTLTTVTSTTGTYVSLAGAAVDWASSTKRGWFIDLGIKAGLRVTYPPQVVTNKVVLVSAISPAQNLVACENAEGTGVNLLFPVEDGLNASYPMFDVNGDSFYTSADTKVAGYLTGADGVDAILRSVKQCSGSVCTTKVVIVDTDDSKKAQVQEATGVLTLKDRVWRRIINPPIR